MKKAYHLFFILAFVLPITLSSQTHYQVDVNIKSPKRFKQGDNYYESSVQGLKSFMLDLKTYDTETYQQLVPMYNKIEEKRNTAIITGGVCSLAGITMCVVGGKRFSDHDFPKMGDDSFNSSLSNRGSGLIFGGIGTVLAGIILTAIIYPSEDDVYRFINSHNRINKNEKLEWEIGFTSMPENGYGASLCFRF